MNYKRLAAIFFILSLAMVLLISCLNQQSPQKQSTVSHTELTQDQQDIVRLLSHAGREVLLFDFHEVDSYTKLELWLEVYEYGELVDHLQGIITFCHEGLFNLPEQLLIIVERSSKQDYKEYRYTFMLYGDGSSASNTVQTQLPLPMARSSGPIRESVVIQENTEFILYMSKFSGSGVLRVHGEDLQIFLEQPHLLRQYSYAHIIKGRFSN